MATRRLCGGGDRGHHFLAHRRGRAGDDAAYGRLLAAAKGLTHLRQFGRFHRGQHVVAGLAVLAHVRLADALDLDVRRLQLVVGHDHHVHLVAQFDLDHAGALFVEQEVDHAGRRLHQHLAGVVLHRVLFDQTQGRQRQRLHAADLAVAVATRAGDLGGFAQAGAQSLTRHFEQAETRDAADLHAGAVELQRVLQAILHLTLVTRAVHVDEVDHDQAAGVADARLASHFHRGLAVGVERGFLDVAALGGLRRVDVDGGQRLGLVDHDRAAGRQPHLAVERALDLGLDLVAGEQRGVVLVQLELAQRVRHHLLHELPRVVEQRLVVDQDLADVTAQVVAQGADEQLRFLVDQERRLLLAGGLGNRLPQGQQVVQVPLQLFGVAAQAGGAHDEADVVRHGHVVQRLLQRLPVLALDPARHAAGLRVVRHQHHVAAGQADEGGQGGALVAALLLLHLHDHFLAFLDQLADARLVMVEARREVLAGDFLQRQEAVAFGAVFDEAGLERSLDAGDSTLVDIGLLLFPRGDFDVQVVQVLAIDNGHAQLFTLSRVDQHTFHGGNPRLGRASRASVAPRMAACRGSRRCG